MALQRLVVERERERERERRSEEGEERKGEWKSDVLDRHEHNSSLALSLSFPPFPVEKLIYSQGITL